MKRTIKSTVSAAILLAATAWAGAASAGEYGMSLYPLGSQISMPGFTPPPGIFLTDTVISYRGEASDTVTLPLGIRLGAGVEEDVLVNALTLAVFPDAEFLGARPGFAATMPVGRVGIDASTTFAPPLYLPGPSASAEETGIGDLQLSAILGWNEGVHNWNVTGTLVLPTGHYDAAELANVGLNRTAFDLKGAYTYMNPANGLEFSTAAGFTFNGENQDTEYQSGTEFHFEASVSRHFQSGWAVGVGGYYLTQLTGDSGPGATLGDFEGEVAAFGPIASYTFHVGPAPVQLSARWFHEFDTQNRARGDSIQFSLSMPLAAFGTPPQ